MSLRAVPTEPPALPDHEPYVNARELAAWMRVSERTIRTFTAEGMPHERWGLRLVRYRPSEALAWARTRKQAS